MVSKSGFGAIPIQRISFAETDLLLQKAYATGINFFDTARAYTDSEEKIGHALAHVRANIIIATKSPSEDRQSVLRDLEISLKNLKTDYIDIYQLHNPKSLPDPNDKNSAYGGLLEAKKKGMIRWLGLTNHRLEVAVAAVKSGSYDTVQFPLSSLSSEKDLQLFDVCQKRDVGLIIMKALAGGLITNAASTFAFLRQYGYGVPIWGIETESQLDQFITMEKNPPLLDEQMRKMIDEDRASLGGTFCRACGYCMPCPAGIPIPMAARMSLLLRRMPYQQFMTEDWRAQMQLIDQCQNCGQCKKQCPYQLDTPKILQEMLKDYQQFYEKHR